MPNIYYNLGVYFPAKKHFIKYMLSVLQSPEFTIILPLSDNSSVMCKTNAQIMYEMTYVNLE